MKKIALFITFLVMLSCISVKSRDTVNDVRDVKAEIINENEALISWNVSGISNASGVEVLRKTSVQNSYTSLKKLSLKEKKLSVKREVFEYEYLVRILYKDGAVSDGVSINISGRNPNIVLDRIDGRICQIYLPDSYHTSDKRYPVIYMLDGQNLFVEETASGGEWGIDELLKKLESEKLIEEVIVVGIYNGGARRASEYVPYEDKWIRDNMRVEKPMAGEHASFIVNNIIPYIDTNYRTKSDRNDRMIMGSSFGGIFAFWTGLKYDRYFSFVGAISPSFWTGNGEALKDTLNIPKKDIKIWIDTGSNEWDRYPRDMVDILLTRGYTFGKDLFYYEQYEGEHTNKDFGIRAESPILLFKGKDPGVVVNSDLKFQTGIHDLSKPYMMVNPVLIYENGLKYSAVKSSVFEFTDKSGKQTVKDGIIDYKKDYSFRALVTTLGISREIEVTEAEAAEKMRNSILNAFTYLSKNDKDMSNYSININESAASTGYTRNEIIAGVENLETLGIYKIKSADDNKIILNF